MPAPTSAPHANGASASASNRDIDADSRGNVPEPIAICGMALRLPGGIMTPQQFWDFLIEKKDARGRVPASRFNIDSYYSEKEGKGRLKTDHGYFLDDSVDLGSLDASFFHILRHELPHIDPQQRQLLEVTRECFESAGETSYSGRSIGVFVGSFGQDWHDMVTRDTQHRSIYKTIGCGDFALSNRISYEFDLRGPSMTIRTGCSAALIALHEACGAITRGDCDSAIVAGSSLVLGPGSLLAQSDQGVLSPHGSSKTFDADADGYARADAINAVYLKSLKDALRDGNPIRSVIRSTAINCDGHTSGIVLPSSESHEAMMRRAYEIAGIRDLGQTAFVECHGTGTAAGDPLEAVAVANVFGEKGIFIGSVKPNVGHSEGASGITSLIKVVLSLEHKVIPPNIKFDKPNPKIPFKEGKLTVPLEATPWPINRSERASVNSFGIGGANAHVILESSRGYVENGYLTNTWGKHQSNGHTSNGKIKCSDRLEDDASLQGENEPLLLLYSANTKDSLRRQATQLALYADSHPAVLRDLAYTLAARREHLPYRAFAIAGHNIDSNTSLFSKATEASPGLVMVFTGQGAQWPQMGKELLNTHPVFLHSIRKLDSWLAELPHRPSWTIEEELRKKGGESNVGTASYAQPLCTAIQIGVVDALAAIGIRANAVIGHSSGEIAAAYAAGRLLAKEAIIAAFYRGLTADQVQTKGSMAAIGLGWEETTPYLIEGVVIACENSPSSVTISGDVAKVDIVVEAVKRERPNVLARLLKVDKAYHSHHMKSAGKTYDALIKPHISGEIITGDQNERHKVVFFSSVSGKRIKKADKLNAAYWRSNLESPVRFNTALMNLLAYESENENGEHNKKLTFLEIGPHSALQGPIRQILSKTSTRFSYVPTLIRDQHSTLSFLSSIGNLYQQNLPIDYHALSNSHGSAKVLCDLPPYPWQHDASYWSETRLSKEWRFPSFPPHDLLGTRLPEAPELEPAWRNVFKLEELPWLRDHRIQEDIVFPAAGYISMAIEGMRQIALTTAKHNSAIEHPLCGFRLRNIVVEAAMVLTEGATPVENLTCFKRMRWTNSLDSQWWEFSIFSYNGISWSKHCYGEVMPIRGEIPAAHQDTKTLPRKVDSVVWYAAMGKLGLNYGPSFQGLEDISAATMKDEATATVGETESLELGDGKQHTLHPATIDRFLQLLCVAATRGLARTLKILSVPTNFKELELYFLDPGTTVDMTVGASVLPTGGLLGGGQCTSTTGSIAMRLNGARMTPVERHTPVEDPHAAARTHWRPDLDFLDIQSLIKGKAGDRSSLKSNLDELNSLCVAESLQLLQGVHTQHEHLKKFHNWLSKQPVPAGVDDISSSAVRERIGSIASQIKIPEGSLMAECVLNVLESIPAIFDSSVDALSILTAEDRLTRLYDMMTGIDITSLMQAFRHKKPNMRVLEIGAGTGGATSQILQSLTDELGRPFYSTYTFTDISSGFFPAAKERFAGYKSMEFQVLDISQNATAQGFLEESYDLIIASNVIHATPSLQHSLENVRSLLHPEGKLLMYELHSTNKCINFIMGILPGWWAGDADGRIDEPYICPDRWDRELKSAGFSGIEATVLDAPEPFNYVAAIVAKPALSVEGGNSGQRQAVTLLCENFDRREVVDVTRVLQEAGFCVSKCTLADDIAPDQEVFAMLDLDTPFLEDINEEKFVQFQTFLIERKDAGVFWVTQPSQVECVEPLYAQIVGAARVLRNDLALDLATCEVDDFANSLDAVLEVFKKFATRSRNQGEELRPDFEYLINGGTVYIPRWLPFVLTKEPNCEERTERERQTMKLDIEIPGKLNTLTWKSQPLRKLGDFDVEIETKAVGMNFRDVLVARGIIDVGPLTLGLDCSGIIRDVGAKVTDFKVGDRVIASGQDCFASTVITSQNLCAILPNRMTFEEGATIPCVYATVLYSLVDVARMERDQSILIHSACGGVGIAALHIALLLGLEIFCTVGSEEKVQYLMHTFNIPRSRIFNSRDTSFLPDLKGQTEGRGVDVVLNSLSGELLHTSWECVAEFGTLVEIGKRDLMGGARLEMGLFLGNRTYSGVDLTLLTERRPQVMRRLLREISEYLSDGKIQPITPVKSFPAESIRDCFLFMQKGQHLGKIVVSMESLSNVVPAQPQVRPNLDRTGSYLLVGGFGGLGRSVSTWMVEHGVRELIYLSRSAGKSSSDQSFITELLSQGCHATAVQGDVANFMDVQRAVAAARKPLKGVLQLSADLRDQEFSRMTQHDWTTTIAGKIKGTINLHTATIEAACNLDFFVLFSSISAVIGQYGQTNYAAGNVFMDSFVQFRQRHGLPAYSINIGMMEDLGIIGRTPALLAKLMATGSYGLREEQLHDALTLAINARQPTLSSNMPAVFVDQNQFILGLRSPLSLTDPASRQVWRRDSRGAFYHNSTSSPGQASKNTGTSDADKLSTFLKEAIANPAMLMLSSTAEFIARQIAVKVCDFLLRPVSDESEVNIKASPSRSGLDSLVAIEVKSWWKLQFKSDISVLEILAMDSYEDLGKRAAQGLFETAGEANFNNDMIVNQMKAP